MSGMMIRAEDFVRMFRLGGNGLPPAAAERLENMNLTYREANRDELAEYVLTFIKLIDANIRPRSREENLEAFENGWSANLAALRAASAGEIEKALKPGYFRDVKFFRFGGQLVIPENPQIEHDAFIIARMCLFKKYLERAHTVCELGCGSGANLQMLSLMYPDAALVGLDWTGAAARIASELASRCGTRISGRVFDLLNPDNNIRLPEGAAIITIHAFEQLGRNYHQALDYIIAAKPSIVLQYEPVLEFYDDSNLLDLLALKYCRARNYLNGYYARLRELEALGRIKILEAFRPFLGGSLHEASILAWAPVSPPSTQKGAEEK